MLDSAVVVLAVIFTAHGVWFAVVAWRDRKVGPAWWFLLDSEKRFDTPLKLWLMTVVGAVVVVGWWWMTLDMLDAP